MKKKYYAGLPQDAYFSRVRIMQILLIDQFLGFVSVNGDALMITRRRDFVIVINIFLTQHSSLYLRPVRRIL